MCSSMARAFAQVAPTPDGCATWPTGAAWAIARRSAPARTPWPCFGTPELKHPGTHILYNTSLEAGNGGGTFRPRFGLTRERTLADAA